MSADVVSFAVILLAVLFFPLSVSVLNAGETKEQPAPQKNTLQKNSLPVYAVIEPEEYQTLISTISLENASKSILFPEILAQRIRSLTENSSEDNADGDVAKNDIADDAALSLLSRWAADTVQTLAAAAWFAEQGQYRSCIICQRKLEDNVTELANIRRIMQLRNSSRQKNLQNIMLEEIQLGLEERCLLWKNAFRAALEPALPISRLFDKSIDDLRRLAEKTSEAEKYFLKNKTATENEKKIGQLWCEYLETQAFRADLEAAQRSLQQIIIRATGSPSVIPLSLLTSFSDRVNAVLSRLNSKELTKEQLNYLDVSQIIEWKKELSEWTADTVSVNTLLYSVEQYEKSGGMNDMRILHNTIQRFSNSPTESFRRIGFLTKEIYGGSNVKIYISKVLVNHLLPPSEPETAAFREIILQQPVVGKRQTELNVSMNFHSDKERLLLSLDVEGEVSTASRSNVFASTLFNRGQADFTARKKIELTEKGFQLEPSEVQIHNNRLELLGLQTNFDGVPLLSGMFRGIVKNQYEAKRSDANQETRQKIAQQVRNRLNNEAEERFGEFNKKMQKFNETSLDKFGLFFEKKNAATEDNWLLTSWAIRSADSLSGNTPAPETLPGAFADIKVHESAVNTVFSRLDLEGKEFTVGSLKQVLAERFNFPGIAVPGDNDDIVIGLAEKNPFTIRFVNGEIQIRLAFASFRLLGKTHRNFEVLVHYLPVITSDGKVALQRSRVLNLYNVNAQIPIRAAFGKIFPVERPYILSPKMLETDERFAGLKLGQCRIEKGWLALALIADEEKNAVKKKDNKTLTSGKTPVSRSVR
ncbi:hypothetical protein FACS189427_06240 [Planctomycetales bacterium]|nr:hypothetical protein FACS189427_06240 [Planctomycetales bacterium]